MATNNKDFFIMKTRITFLIIISILWGKTAQAQLEENIQSSTWSPRGLVEFGDFKEVLSIPGRYLNDHCLIYSGSEWHFFGIVGPVGKGVFDKGSEVSFAHASSVDLEHWLMHDDVIKASGVWPEWEHVYAPNVIKRDGIYYMLYTALSEDGTNRLCLATSTDLFDWNRYEGNPVITPSLSWARWVGYGDENGGNCRDPHILQLEDGSYVAYWVAEMNPKFGANLTCVAASVSQDLIHWQEVGPVFVIEAWDDGVTRAVESPGVVKKDGRYWLFFKHGWWTHFVVSDDPLNFKNKESVRLGFSHASEIFKWQGEWMISHCSADPQDYMYRKSNRKNGFYLGRLHWPDGEYPRLIAPDKTD